MQGLEPEMQRLLDSLPEKIGTHVVRMLAAALLDADKIHQDCKARAHEAAANHDEEGASLNALGALIASADVYGRAALFRLTQPNKDLLQTPAGAIMRAELVLAAPLDES